MNIQQWKDEIRDLGVNLRPIWEMSDPDGRFELRAFQAFKDGMFLRPVIVQELFGDNGEDDGLIVYGGFSGNTVIEDFNQLVWGRSE